MLSTIYLSYEEVSYHQNKGLKFALVHIMENEMDRFDFIVLNNTSILMIDLKHFIHFTNNEVTTKQYQLKLVCAIKSIIEIWICYQLNCSHIL